MHISMPNRAKTRHFDASLPSVLAVVHDPHEAQYTRYNWYNDSTKKPDARARALIGVAVVGEKVVELVEGRILLGEGEDWRQQKKECCQ